MIFLPFLAALKRSLRSDLERRLSSLKRQSEVLSERPASRKTKPEKQGKSKNSDQLSSNEENDVETDERGLQLQDLNDKKVRYTIYSIVKSEPRCRTERAYN